MKLNEYISKEQACKELERFIGYLDEDMIHRLKIAIRRIPATDVREVKKGKWTQVREKHLYLLCSICHEPYAKLDVLGIEQNKNFCPNCGADMREE